MSEKSYSQRLLEGNKQLFGTNKTAGSINLYSSRRLFEDIDPSAIEFDHVTVPPEPQDVPAFYGLKNDRGEPVIPEQEYLKQVPSSGQTLRQLMNFAADAFRDFHEHFQSARSQNRIASGEESIIPYLNANRAWEDGDKEYHQFVNSMVKVFVEEEVSETSKFDEISGFWDFVDHFEDFVKKLAKKPFSRMMYFSSPFANPFSSGLVVDVLAKKYGNDQKVVEFYADPNYQFYASSARKFGFMIDKHAPWRLYADFNSPNMIPYMKDYNLTSPQQVFENQYINTLSLELDNIKNLLVEAYNNYVVAVKEKGKKKFQKCSNGSYQTKRTGLDILTREKYESIDQKEFIPFLCNISLRYGSYVRADGNPAQKTDLIQRAQRVMDSAGQTPALRQIYGAAFT